MITGQLSSVDLSSVFPVVLLRRKPRECWFKCHFEGGARLGDDVRLSQNVNELTPTRPRLAP